MDISRLYKENLNASDQMVLTLQIVLIFAGLVCIFLNAVTFRYSGDHYVFAVWFWRAPLLLALVVFSVRLKISTDIAFLLKSYCLYFLALFAFLVMLSGVQYTPFPVVDSVLSAADQTLRIKETVLMDWAYAHPVLLTILRISYHSVIVQWLLIPLLLFLLRDKQQFYFYLITSLLAYLIGAAIYYFFPSMGPASIYSNPHFSLAQIDAIVHFKQIHQYIMVTHFDSGMIAFPSFHVLWSVITIYVLRKIPTRFFAPILILNSIAITATLFLGWNYAADIVCGVVVGCVAIYFAGRLLRSAQQTDKSYAKPTSWIREKS